MKTFLSAAEIAAAAGLCLVERSADARRKVRNFVGEQMDDLPDRAKDTLTRPRIVPAIC
jgi:hypothetical protein